MADAVLSALLQVVFQQLASPILEEFRLQRCVDKQLKKLPRILSRIQAVLSDAEQRQTQENAVRIWLRDLKDEAYDADDLLDEMVTEALRPNKVRNFLSSFSIASKIDDVIERLEEIAKEREDLRLREGTGMWSYGIKERLQTSSLIDDSSVIGRSDDRAKIISLLLSAESNVARRQLQNLLKGRRFLLVLDDVWNENETNWDSLQIPFKVGAEGSRIIVTTEAR
ncbi:Nb-arc domain-containing disease resistance protein [Thalictrum thalictroides]|uniref:Nb-arc domain-containing disease resistance protein n=1 Tax=Thalictrum thalictroides TaxID=46969 RepID=A0A7J6WKE5_THATH|nr:Nb-arc domain-containing disease resistance protein [Thalictrum thalictroides]